MEHKDKIKSLAFIRPNAEFILRDNELEWLDKKQDKPTQEELEKGWVAYQAAEKAEAEAKTLAKTAAQAKLAALGLTVEDLSALGL